MSHIPTEYYQPKSSKEIALQRLAASRQEIVLLTHLLQASLVVERNNPFRQAMIAHPHLVRNVMILIVVLLSAAIGLLAPDISRALRPY